MKVTTIIFWWFANWNITSSTLECCCIILFPWWVISMLTVIASLWIVDFNHRVEHRFIRCDRCIKDFSFDTNLQFCTLLKPKLLMSWIHGGVSQILQRTSWPSMHWWSKNQGFLQIAFCGYLHLPYHNCFSCSGCECLWMQHYLNNNCYLSTGN